MALESEKFDSGTRSLDYCLKLYALGCHSNVFSETGNCHAGQMADCSTLWTYRV